MRKALFFACFSILAASSAAVAGLIPQLLDGKRAAGHVIDAETRRPIEGAYVALLWRSGIVPKGFTGHNSRDICYHAAATRTDDKGHFDIPAWKKWSNYDVLPRAPTVLVYTQGYKPVQQLTLRASERGPVEHLDELYVLTPFKGSVEERLDSLFSGLANQSCDFGGQSQKSLYPMLKAIYQEARAIAPNDQLSLEAFATEAAYAALALDPLGPAHSDRVRAFILENLK